MPVNYYVRSQRNVVLTELQWARVKLSGGHYLTIVKFHITLSMSFLNQPINNNVSKEDCVSWRGADDS
jgi:hypothetical protein